MTEQKPQEAGAFDRLPGAGKPLPGLTEGYDPLWWLKKLVQREQISVLPPSLELLRKVKSELAKIWQVADEAQVRSRLLALNAEIAKVNARAAEGPPTRLGLLNVDEIVAEWRARTSHSP